MGEDNAVKGFHAYTVSRGGVVKYVGITMRGVAVRWSEHLKQNSQNTALSNAIKKHGVDAFVVEHVASARDYQSLMEIERTLIIQHETLSPKGYNLKEGGGQHFRFSEETRRRMAARQLGKRPTAETLAKLKAAKANHKQPPHTAEAKAKMSASRLGVPRGPMPEHRKAKISASKSGKPGHPVSAEAREKIAASKRGKPGHTPTAETRALMSAARKGKSTGPRSLATRHKMSMSAKNRRVQPPQCRPSGSADPAQLSLL